MKIRWPVIIVLVLLLALALAGGFTMLWRLFILLAVLLAASYIWLRVLARRIEGRADKPPYSCRVGENFEESFTVKNNGRLPMLLTEVEETADIPGYRNTVKISLPSRGSFTWPGRGLCRRRGQYRIGSLKAKIFDPLGFFSITRELTDSTYLNVLPAVVDLPYFQVLPRREPGLSTRRWFAGEPGQNASRVREYVSGDSLRYVHWHTTAHTGQIMVKEFDPDLTRTYSFSDVWIVLDMHRDSVFGADGETTAEYGITIAASLVKKYLDNEKKVALIASGDSSYLFLPDEGNEHAYKIDRALARIKPTGEVPIADLITSQEERIAHGSAVILITPSGFQSLNIPARLLLARGAAVTAVLLDAASFGGGNAAADTARAFSSIGINAYIVRHGADLSQSLDIRHNSPAQYPGFRKH